MQPAADRVRGSRVLVGAVQMLLQAAISLGLDRAALLEAAGLEEADLADRDAYLPFARQLALGEAMARMCPGQNLGLAALRVISPANFGVLGYLITHSASLRDALDMFVRFQRLLTDGVRWRVIDGEPVRIVVEADPAYERIGHPIEAMVGLWVLLGRTLTETNWSPRAVCFRHQPLCDTQELERFFAARVQFGAPTNELHIARKMLALPVSAAKAALQPSLRQVAEARLAEVEGYGSLAAQLRGLLFGEIPRGVTARQQLAASLGISERTLNRRLREEGTTFREVLDGVRRELAETWLVDPSHAIYEVAFLLGYSEPSTFHRSFRRWTGLSPHAWRRARAD